MEKTAQAHTLSLLFSHTHTHKHADTHTQIHLEKMIKVAVTMI